MLIESGLYLTATASAWPVAGYDVTNATTLYATPLRHNNVPCWDPSANQFVMVPVGQLSLDLNPSKFISNCNYHVLIIPDPTLGAAQPRMVLTPPWQYAGYGTSDTGSGGSYPAIGHDLATWLPTNLNAMTVDDADNSYSIAANVGVRIGTIRPSPGNGNAPVLNRVVTAGQNVRNDVWNAFNQAPTVLKCSDPASTFWEYDQQTWRYANGNSGNNISLIIGKPQLVECAYRNVYFAEQDEIELGIQINNQVDGNSHPVPSGYVTSSGRGVADSVMPEYINPSVYGAFIARPIERIESYDPNGPQPGTPAEFWPQERSMLLTVKYLA